jgi:acetyl-CoA/propionyl-CoA carboxylase biotin carboxyl carrier protein
VVTFLAPAGAGVRCDAGIVSGGVVPPEYDPLIAKVIAHASDRAGALHRLTSALRELVVLGVTTNTEFLTALLCDRDVVAGSTHTQLVTRSYAGWSPAAAGSTPSSPDAVAAALAITLAGGRAGSAVAQDGTPSIVTRGSPWDVLPSWRIGGTGR